MKVICLARVFIVALFACFTLTTCAGGKPDLAVIKEKLERDIPKGALKFGNCNEVRIRIFNRSNANHGANATNTQLVIRERNESGKLVYQGKAKTGIIPAGEYRIALFNKVNIPKSETTLYYIEATADIDNNEDEYNEKNNSASIKRVVEEDC